MPAVVVAYSTRRQCRPKPFAAVVTTSGNAKRLLPPPRQLQLLSPPTTTTKKKKKKKKRKKKERKGDWVKRIETLNGWIGVGAIVVGCCCWNWVNAVV